MPCGPTHVRSEVQCLSDVLSISWDRTKDAEGYIATVVSTNTRELVYCNSTSPACNVSNLQCGDAYSVQVRSYNGTCLSMPSQPLVIREGEVLIHSQNISFISSFDFIAAARVLF